MRRVRTKYGRRRRLVNPRIIKKKKVMRFGSWIVVEKKGKKVRARPKAEMLALAAKVKDAVQPFSERVEVAGSIRRRATPLDIDVVVVPKDKERIKQAIKKLGGKVKASGDRQFFADVEGVGVDIFFATEDDFGAQLMTRTGSANYNIGLRKKAREQGRILNQYGLFDKKTGRRLAGKTEASIYKALGRPRVRPPQER